MRSPLFLLAFAICLGSTPARAATVGVDALVAEALANHPQALAASASVAAQAAAIGRVEAQQLPQVSLTSGYAQTTSISNTQTASQSLGITNGQLAVRQQIWDFGRTGQAIAEARAGADAAQAQARLSEVDVAHGVRRAYLLWLREHTAARAAAGRADSARRIRDQARAFYTAGKRSKIDLTRADAALQLAQADLARARLAEQTAALVVDAAVGREGAAAGEPALPPEPGVVARAPADLAALARQGHPALAAARARLRRAQAAREGADLAVWPELRADGKYGFRARDAAPNPNWSVELTLSAPLFDGFATDRARQEAAAAESGAQETLRGAVLATDLDLRRAALAAESASERLPAAEAAVRGALENLELAQGRYAAGVGTVIEVGDALDLLQAAQIDRDRDLVDYHLALADLLRAAGLTGLERDAH
ncbi:MAG: TolC family protein [Candidatus Sericytochromatia bacterium]|nr:TolC family protein [Candidatus Tanganyikabacteria bacterium]